MKTFFFALLWLIFMSNGYGQNNGSWRILNESINQISAIDFVNENVGWMAVRSFLWHTQDGGESWDRWELADGLTFYYINFTTTDIGWAIGISDESRIRNVYKTEDGGLTWFKRSELPENNELYYLAVVNDSVVYMVWSIYDGTEYESDWVYKTSNGGENWYDITPSNSLNRFYLFAVNFFDTQNGFVDAYSEGNHFVLLTHNGGESWQEKSLDSLEYPLSFQILNDSTVLFLARDERYKICKTNDQFDSWTVIYAHDYNIHSIYALDEKTVYAVMQDSLWTMQIMKSVDGGQTWEKKQDILAGIVNLYFSSEQVGFILGYGYYRTTNAGDNWILHNFSVPLNSVSFLNENLGFVGCRSCGGHGGCGGQMFMTADGGETWDYKFSDAIFSMQFVNDYVGYYLSDESVYKTVDQGQSWTSIFSDNYDLTGYSVNGFSVLDFKDEQTGWLFVRISWNDSSGIGILGTTDGGKNWELQWKYPDMEEQWSRLNAIHSIDTTAWAVGEAGMIVKYNERDGWRLRPVVTDLPLNDVFFWDEQYGWISASGWGIDQPCLLKTNNSGKTWQQIPLVQYWINDMFFRDSLQGLAAGYDTSRAGLILETSDGGSSWRPVVEGLSSYLNALYYKDGTVWAVGSRGLILKTEDWTTWINPYTNAQYPSHHKLYQNYPNPFNPSTTIEFTLPKSEYVDLKVYNILGKEVSTLVSKKLNQGNHIYTFDGKSLASGIYYYQLTAGDYREVKKMILLK
jgi:photosystem II stability/assembly factor-like uncharacterized protein